MSSDPTHEETTILNQEATSFGGYEILAEVARGGMGVVYKARQLSLDRVVALKLVQSGSDASESELRRFQVEAKAAARLDHPYIVPVYEIGEHQGQHFFSMGFVDGPSLSVRLAQSGPLPPREAAELLRKMALAVDYAHRQGVIHRDLKPGNVLLTASGEPKVTDFGLAKRLESDQSLTATGQVFGTPAYMSPEQAQGDHEVIGPASDVYSLGATLFAALTGRPPFTSTVIHELLIQVTEEPPPSLRTLSSKVPAALEAICLKCLAKSPADRYPSAGVLAEDLRDFVAGSLEVRQTVATRRRRLAKIGAAAAVTLLISLITASTVFVFQSRREARRQLATELETLEQRVDAAGKLPAGTLAETQLMAGEWERMAESWESLRRTNRAEADSRVVKLDARLRSGLAEARKRSKSFQTEIDFEHDLNDAIGKLWIPGDPEPQRSTCSEAIEVAFRHQGIDVLKLSPENLARHLEVCSEKSQQLAIRALVYWEIHALAEKEKARAMLLNGLLAELPLSPWQRSWQLVRVDGSLTESLQLAEQLLTQVASEDLELVALSLHGLCDTPSFAEYQAFLNKATNKHPQSTFLQRQMSFVFHDKTRDQRTADWVIGKGGFIRQGTFLDKQLVFRTEDLPKTNFVLDGISLSDAPIVDADLAHLYHLKGVLELHIAGTQITDSGLDRLLRQTPSIGALNVERTGISEAGLKRMANLAVLFARRSRVSEQWIKNARVENPNALIMHDSLRSVDVMPSDLQQPRSLLWFDGDSTYGTLPVEYACGSPLTIEATIRIPPTIPTAHGDLLNGIGQPRQGGFCFRPIGGWDLALSFKTASDDWVGQQWRWLAPIKRFDVDRYIKVAATYEEKIARFFIDGTLFRIDNIDYSATNSILTPLVLGGAKYGVVPVHHCFRGFICDVRLSSNCRYRSTYVPRDNLETDEHTLGLYRINEGAGDRLKDASGHERHGTVHGKVKWVRWDELPN